MVAARRTKLPETDTDWMGKFRDKKEGWRSTGRRGGSGGGGRACQLSDDEMGSRVYISSEWWDWDWDWDWSGKTRA